MSLMSARRLAVIVVAWLCSLAAGLVLGGPAAFAACPNEAARGGPSAELPDCRAYEMVTPANKSTIVQDMSFKGGSGVGEEAAVAVNGERVAMNTTIEGLGETPDIYRSFVLFRRTPDGWVTESIAPPNLGSGEIDLSYGEYLFNSDLTEEAYTAKDNQLFPTSPDRTFYAGPPNGPLSTLTEPYDEEKAWLDMRGATSDFSSIFFDSQNHTLTGSPSTIDENAPAVYRWEKDGGLSLVNVYPNGSPVSPCGAEFKGVSEDGSKVFFTAPDVFNDVYDGEPGCKEPQRLYMRVGSSIVDVAEPEAGVVDPTGYKEVKFDGSSANGARVFFTTATELTKGDEGNHEPMLYEYNTETSTLTLISVPVPGEQGGVSTAIVSQDGSRVYYIDGGAGVLYRYNTETKETHEIASVGTVGDAAGYTTKAEGTEDGEEGMRMTPNGKTLIFYTRYAVNGLSTEPGRDEAFEVFRYDDETGELGCVSCLPADAPRNKATERGESWFRNPAMFNWDYTPPNTDVSNDGSYVFFESTTQLTPKAVNVTGGSIVDPEGPEGTPLVADIYEWHNGVISLIGSPTDNYTQVLLGASEDGSNVFFLSHSPLVPQDIDNSGNIYDARIDGGFPPAVEAAACEGDTCVHPPPALNDPTPGSLTFSGPGNPPGRVLEPKAGTKPKAKRCAKGKVRKGGRCVRERRKTSPTRRHSAVKRSVRGVVKHDLGGGR
jgi:hypothetical protein